MTGKLTEKWVERLRAALDYVNGEDSVPEQHRATLKRAVEGAMLDAMEALERAETTENDAKQWRPDELEAFKQFLEKQGRLTDFGGGNEVLEIASRRFRRSSKRIRNKAIDMGFGDRVDYWIARSKGPAS